MWRADNVMRDSSHCVRFHDFTSLPPQFFPTNGCIVCVLKHDFCCLGLGTCMDCRVGLSPPPRNQKYC